MVSGLMVWLQFYISIMVLIMVLQVNISILLGNYNEYFDSKYLDEDAIVYLMIANLLSKSIYDKVILIAEDVSGFPGLCRSL